MLDRIRAACRVRTRRNQFRADRYFARTEPDLWSRYKDIRREIRDK